MMYENLSQEDYDKLVQRCIRIVFPNGYTDFTKSLLNLYGGFVEEIDNKPFMLLK